MSSYKTTNTFAKVYKALENHTEVILQGGKGSGKTTAILQYLIFKAISKKEKDLVISIVDDTLTNLEKGAMRIFKALLRDMGLTGHFKTDGKNNTWTNKYNGNLIEFFGVANNDVALGARRDYLYVNECRKLDFESYLSLSGRSKVVIMDFNPEYEFWVHTEGLAERDNTVLFITDFTDNQYLPQGEVDQLLWYKSKAYHDPDLKDEKLLNAKSNIKSKFYLNKWLVFGKGQLGIAEGLIFTEHEDWEEIPELPEGARYIGSGMDFGFSHVTAIVKLYQYNDKIILKESLFKAGMTAPMIAAHIKKDPELMSSVVGADESRPEMIAELVSLGCPVLGVSKGSGSVDMGLDLMHSHDLQITSDSTNILKEFRAYAYATDKNGKSLGVPDKAKDVDNSIDAARYAFMHYLSASNVGGWKLRIVA